MNDARDSRPTGTGRAGALTVATLALSLATVGDPPVAVANAATASLMREQAATLAGDLREADADEVATLKGFNSDIDDFHAHGREVYWLARVRQSDSKFNNNVFERALRRKATFRGMNTVQRLARAYAPAGGPRVDPDA